MINIALLLLLSACCMAPINASPNYYAVLADLDDTFDTTTSQPQNDQDYDGALVLWKAKYPEPQTIVIRYIKSFEKIVLAIRVIAITNGPLLSEIFTDYGQRNTHRFILPSDNEKGSQYEQNLHGLQLRAADHLPLYLKW